MQIVRVSLVLLCMAQPLAAQARKPDAKPRQRVPAKPVIRVWEVGAMVGITAGAMLIDERVRNALNRDTAKLPSILVRFGDAAGNPVESNVIGLVVGVVLMLPAILWLVSVVRRRRAA